MDRIPVEEYLSNLHPDVQGITRELIQVARNNMPGVHVFIYQDTVRFSMSDSASGQICYIVPRRKGDANSGFFFGAGPPDPQNLLIGEGKRLRHVKVWSVQEVQNPVLAKLIAAAWKKAPQSIAEIHASHQKSMASK